MTFRERRQLGLLRRILGACHQLVRPRDEQGVHEISHRGKARYRLGRIGAALFVFLAADIDCPLAISERSWIWFTSRPGREVIRRNGNDAPHKDVSGLTKTFLWTF